MAVLTQEDRDRIDGEIKAGYAFRVATSGPRTQIIFARIARRAVDSGTAHDIIMPPHVMSAERYFELLVLELADQYSKRGEDWFREHYKEHIS